MEWSSRPWGSFIFKKRLILGTILTFGLAFSVQVTTIPYLTLTADAHEEEAVPSEVITTVEDVELAMLDQNAVDVPLHGPGAEAYVRDYFKDVPVLAEIARCESSFRQIDPKTGSVLQGVVNSNDLGMMQINILYHGETAKKLGHDLKTLEGNLAYARHLYEKQGTQPWGASRECWQHGSHLALR